MNFTLLRMAPRQTRSSRSVVTLRWCRMVGMAALAVVAVLAFSMVDAKSPCDDVDPAIQSFTYDFTAADSCLYIRREDKDWEGAQKACESLDRHPLKWRLVELKTESVQNAIDQLMTVTKVGNRYYLFWIGLVRETVKDSSDFFNQSAWANPSKWRWTSDKSNLLSRLNGSQVPWGTDEPDGWAAYANGNTPSQPELCVQLNGRPHAQSNYWKDSPCNGLQLNQPSFLVCESMDVRKTTTPTTTISSPTSPMKPETNSSCCSTTQIPDEPTINPWIWVGIILAIIVVIALVTFLAYRIYQHYYQKRHPFMLTADSDQSGTYQNMRRFKGKRRQMISESESLNTSSVSKQKRPKKPMKDRSKSWMKDRSKTAQSISAVQLEGKAPSPDRHDQERKLSRSLSMKKS